jgi:hypothetical protein
MAIDALADPQVVLPDALRRLLVVSRRIGAADLSNWVLGELNGYTDDAELPKYRRPEGLSIKLRFDGPMQSSATRHVSAAELPRKLSSVTEGHGFREPVAELSSLANADDDPELQLPLGWIASYRRFAEERKAPSIEYMVLNHAGISIPRTHLQGILDRIKSTALDLALSLEDVSPHVGDSGGPTVEDEPMLARQIQIHLTQVFASDSTITLGDNATVASGVDAIAVHVDAGDIDALLSAAAALLQPDAVEALAQALRHDGALPAAATKTFLDRVKAGAVGLVGGVTSNAAYDSLVVLLKRAFPGALDWLPGSP